MKSVWVLTFFLLLAACSDSGVLKVFCPDCASNLSTADLTDDDNSATGFGGGSSSSIAYTSGVLKQNSLTTNEIALDQSWTPKWENIIAYYKFDETAYVADTVGQAVDSSPNGTNSGTPRDGANTTSEANGKVSRGVEFDAISDAIDVIGIADDINMQRFSLAFWYKRDELVGGVKTIFEVVGTAGTGSNWLLAYYAPASNDVRFFHRANTTASQLSVSESYFPDGEWTHVVYILNAASNNHQLFVNAQPVDSQNLAFAAWTDTIATTTISSTAASSLEGALDDFAIWNDLLDKNDVRVLYERQRAKYASVFESRVMDAQENTTWGSLSWLTTLPFGKEVPDGGGVANSESSNNYSSLVGSAGMVGDNDLMNFAIGIYHMNETVSGSVGGNDLEDKSGGDNHCTETGAGISYDVHGVFETAKDFDGVDHFVCPDNPFDFGAGQDFAVSLWYQSQNSSNENLVGKQVGATGWTIQINAGEIEVETPFGAITTGVNIQDGRWRHIVFTREATFYRVYVDGRLEAQSTAISVNLSTATGLKIGEGNGTSASGLIDEVVIWNRHLENDEVLQLYRRGVNRIDFQVRSCANSDCSDQELESDKGWKGSDSTNQTYINELINVNGSGDVLTTPPSPTITPGTSRYIQYRVFMGTDDENTTCNGITTTCVPELESVTLGN